MPQTLPPIIVLGIGFVLGHYIPDFFGVQATLFVVGFFISSLWFRKFKALQLLSFFALFVLLGSLNMYARRTISPVNEGSSLIHGTIEEVYPGAGSYSRARMKVDGQRSIERYAFWKPAKEYVLITFSKESNLRRGDVILGKFTIEKIRNAHNPYEFDQRMFWLGKGIAKATFANSDKLLVVDYRPLDPLTAFLDRLKNSARDGLSDILPSPYDAITQALVLGDKSNLDDQVKQTFVASGTMHLLAVSGLHVGILALLLGWIFNRLTGTRLSWINPLLVLLLLWFFAAITGFSGSVVRAVVMFSIFELFRAFRYQYLSLNSLFIAAFVSLLVNPYWVFDIGFQLSYLAMAGILLFNDRIVSWFEVKNKGLKMAWSGIAVGLSAQIMTVPLSLYYFHQFPNYFLLSNLLLVFVATPLVIGAVAITVLNQVSFVSGVFVKLFVPLVAGILFVLQWVESLPGSVAYGFTPAFWWVLLGYAFILSWRIPKFSANRWSWIFGVCLLAWLQAGRWHNRVSNECVVLNSTSFMCYIKQGKQSFLVIDEENVKQDPHFVAQQFYLATNTYPTIVPIKAGLNLKIGNHQFVFQKNKWGVHCTLNEVPVQFASRVDEKLLAQKSTLVFAPQIVKFPFKAHWLFDGPFDLNLN